MITLLHAPRCCSAVIACAFLLSMQQSTQGQDCEFGDFECGDGVDIIDFGKFADNFGIGAQPAASAVPEPTTLALLAISCYELVPLRRITS